MKAFLRAFGRLRTRTGHQIGGHAIPVQGPVEYEIANGALGSTHSWGDKAHEQEAERWVLLAQFDSDSDAKMEWGDAGTLYWLIRPEDLAAHRFGQVRLTVQCQPALTGSWSVRRPRSAIAVILSLFGLRASPCVKARG
ncbi:DUF1963 domain-containing protein [Streptomyces bobili]|uniref:DUF1963 domain-containing protein n=1 Tax=Streptomyces bobili TaxID=67280 RepID=UPI0036F9681B